METAIREEMVPVGGATLWTARQGSGPPMVLCHGGAGMWDYLEPVASMVDDLVTVHRYDQRACGRSSGRGPFTVDRFVEDLEDLRLTWGYEKWIVGGHSWGASLALAYCLRHPSRASALVYASGTGTTLDWRDEHKAEIRRRLGPELHAEMLALKARRYESAAVERAFCRLLWSTDYADRSRAFELAEEMLDDRFSVNDDVNSAMGLDWSRWLADPIVARVPQLHLPALIVHGEMDPRPSWPARDLAASLPGGSFVTLPRSGHDPWTEEKESFRNALRAFIGQVLEPPS